MRKICLAAACAAIGSAQIALATPFPTSGGSYTANVASYLNTSGNFANPATATTTGTATSSGPKGVNDSQSVSSTGGTWTVNGLASGAGTATATIDLGRVWNLNQIYTSYAYFNTFTGIQYQLSLSTDGSTYTPLFAPTNLNTVPNDAAKVDSFASTPARYIQWTVSSTTTNGTVRPMELMAYVASTSPVAPQKEAGYNLARGASILSSNIGTVTHGFSPGSGTFDGTLNNGSGFYPDGNTAGQTAIIDLGAVYPITRITADMYANWDDGSIALSKTSTGPWQFIKNAGSAMNEATFSFPYIDARYIQVTGNHFTSNGIMTELQAFALVPEPTSGLAILALAGAGAMRRRRGGITQTCQ